MTIESILPTLNIFDAKRILCIQPHYDDNDIAAAGILTQLARNSAELFYLTATDDLMGIDGIALYYTREPSNIADISSTWEEKIAAVRCYQAQSNSQDMEQLVMALDMKSQQVVAGQSFRRGEPHKVLHTSALHCGF